MSAALDRCLAFLDEVCGYPPRDIEEEDEPALDPEE